MNELQPIKKAIILYTAVTVIEQLLDSTKDKSDSTNESFVIPGDPDNATNSARRLLKAASQYCKK
ncbi:hypothetical protein AB6G74_09615 [Staphylococcus ureilyticus]|uniref:hypothetical protein n=1 Tax=Staphylococcus ureilyticus TaxID=94138 RepID=UPI0034DD4991